MRFQRRQFLRLTAGAASLPALARAAWAQSYPTRTITLVVPFPAGGGVDTMARVVAERLSIALKHSVVVDNRAGAGGTLGTRAVAKAEPDGYTLLLGHTGTMSINPSLYANAGYDPRKDFAPIGLIASMPVVLIANPTFPAKTVADVIALAKKDPTKVNLGTAPVGTGGYLTAEYFKSAAGLDVQIVPYRGTAPLINDLVGGHVPVSFGVLPPAMGNIQAGTLRAIAVTGTKRFSLLPDVPTADESGLPGFDSVLHYGLLAPARTPPAIITLLNEELRKLVAQDSVKQRIQNEGGDPLTSSPEEYAKDIDQEERKWSALIKKLNLKVE
ncbi:tripartite tricarboxylate transporter substrate binding protein [Bradyrhizobium sp. LHD-71]|uniref:Bug family tripartite tricarboxylate transporter substrate binding protein n=1 Tax=Bradyrhizobium sp. LHD-71 TaxID=3072141 RepID=UPI00280EC064|nr:tripartite tricarboxylate transporter substrate binding protein [Bradyrhizobium sp. LHD-71]MDQ8726169.1 tripartite tricarboxylate transporter substrate binding protein [Bradyrhizobium sp. LHD-71]